jgi:hypothetical protein
MFNIETYLDSLPYDIEEIDVSNRDITVLDVSKFKNLKKLNCNNNQLTSLQLNENLVTLFCSNNQLTSLHLNDNLQELHCHTNQLTSLHLNKNLKTLNTTQFDNNFLYTNRIYPNMSNHTEPKYKKQKLEIATNNYEITSIWMCGIKQRNNALKYNIDKWSDKRLTSKILGIKGNRGRIVDLILKINRSENIIIYPKKIKNNIGNWQNRTNLAFYIDFETLNKTAFEPSIWTNIIHDNYQSSNDIIFMIGIGYSINNQFKYKTLYLNDLSTNQQVLIIEQFIQFIKDISSDNNINYQDVNLYHWSNFEPMILSKLCTKLNIIFPVFKWIDILKIFHTNLL